MKIASLLKFNDFSKLSPPKQIVVITVSILPIIMVIGIIASPFIWRAMVTLLHKKVTFNSNSNSQIQVGTNEVFKRTITTTPSREELDSLSTLSEDRDEKLFMNLRTSH